MGLESELALLGARPLLRVRESIGSALLAAIGATQPHAPGWGSKHRSTLFLANGAAIGLDPPRFVPELSTPECADPFVLAAAHKAGLALITRACAHLREERGYQVMPAVASTFHQPGEVSLGTHENYGVPTVLEPSQLTPALLTWVVARTILTEPGVVDSSPAGEGFSLAPRAELMTRVSGPHTTHDRAIFTTCRLNYAGRGWRRVHLIAAGGTTSSWAIAIRSGVTALLLELILRGHPWPENLTLKDPLRDLRRVSLAPQAPISTVDDEETTALGLNERLLALIEAADAKDPIAPWARPLIAEWQRGLAAIARGDEDECALLIESALRRRVLTAFLDRERLDWRTARLWSHVIDRVRSQWGGEGRSHPATWSAVKRSVGDALASSLQRRIEAEGFSIHDYTRHAELIDRLYGLDVGLARIADGSGAEIDRALAPVDSLGTGTRWRELVEAPPPGTRAEVRGRLIAHHFGASDLRASWAGVVAGGRIYELADPLAVTEPLPRDC